MADLVIRPASDADLSEIRQCARCAYSKYVERIGKEPAPMIADFTPLIGAGHVHVAEVDGAVAGFIVFYPRGDHIHLENVAVGPAWQGHGFGLRLIAFCEEQARTSAARSIELYTNEKMTENLRLYPRLGYTEVGRREEDGFNRVYFSKSLI